MTATARGTSRRKATGPAVSQAKDEPKRKVLMVIDGIDCSVRPDVPFRAALQYMDDVVGLRLVFGQLKLAKSALTEDAYAALLASDVTREQWQELCNAVVGHLFAAPEKEAAQGN